MSEMALGGADEVEEGERRKRDRSGCGRYENNRIALHQLSDPVCVALNFSFFSEVVAFIFCFLE